MGPTKMAHWELHTSGALSNNDTVARTNWYGVSGVPDVRIDGIIQEVGGSTCTAMANIYRTDINTRLTAVDGASPVFIKDASMTINGGTATLSATYLLVDPVPQSDLRATLLLYEDNVYSGGEYWDGVTRKIYDQNITLTNAGDQVTVTTNIAIGSWVPANLVGVAYLQSTVSREVIQVQRIGYAPTPDFSLFYPVRVKSVPAGNGTATFTGQLWNITTSNETFTLGPGTSFGSWTMDFLVCGDPNPHTAPTQITLPPNGTCEFQVRVHTDSAREIRSGSFSVTSNTSGRVQVSPLRVFNGSYAVYLVNDNSNTAHYAIWTTALDQLGYLYDRWDINYGHSGAAPAWGNVAGFDIMIWETGYRTSSFPDASEQSLMMRFVDGGGSLYFTSQGFLNSLNNVQNTFTQNYLGLSGWTLDTGYTSLLGVAGDPIGDGFNIPLSFQFPTFNKGDNAIPSTAVTGLRGEESSSALVHNVKSGAKIVFMPAVFNAISQSDPDPNNQKVLLGRIMDWLRPAPPADAQDAETVLASRIDAVHPNPFNPRTEISFTLSPTGANGAVSLEVFDLGGRKVAQLVNGRMSPGAHVETWTGISDAGKPVQSGVYFARLTTADGMRTQKLVLLK